jgi:hypothetical protein
MLAGTFLGARTAADRWPRAPGSIRFIGFKHPKVPAGKIAARLPVFEPVFELRRAFAGDIGLGRV